MSGLALTTLRPEEAEALAELAERIWRQSYPGIISAAQINLLASRYHPPLIRQTIARRSLGYRARGETLVAFAHSFHLEGGAVKLDKLYVHPNWQRRAWAACWLSGWRRAPAPTATSCYA